MANIPKDLIETLGIMGKIGKNAGISAREAASAFNALSESFKTLPKYVPEIWVKSMVEKTEAPTFFSQYMQQPNVELYETKSTITGTGLTLDEDAIDRAREKIKRITGIQEELMSEEQSTYYPLSERCPACMRQAEWETRDHGESTKCLRCDREFATDWLRSGTFADQRATMLQVEHAEEAGRLFEDRMESHLSYRGAVTVDFRSQYSGTEFPIGTSQQPVNNMTDAIRIADERGLPIEASIPSTQEGKVARIQELLRQRTLSESERRELDAYLELTRDAPSTRREGSFARPPDRLRPLSGQGVTGDSMLMGSEEMLTFEPEERVEVRIPNTRERYVAKKKKPEYVKPLKPLKRKLDI